MAEKQPTPLDERQIEEISFIVVDFETVTPKGHPPEPIELGAMRVSKGLHIDSSFAMSWLIKPPEHAPLTAFDTQQTGIGWQDLRDRPAAQVSLAEFEVLLQEDEYVLVAHNASYEAAIFQRYAYVCPRVAAMLCIDTVALGKLLAPGLANYKLDTLADHFSLPIPLARHRALPDVELTGQIFLRLLATRAGAHSSITTIADLKRVAGLKGSFQQQKLPVQMGLFDA